MAGTLSAVAIGAGPLGEQRRALGERLFTERLERLLEADRFDVVHFHGVDVATYPLGTGALRHVPKLVTLHLPIDWYPPELFRTQGNLVFNTVSDWQQRELPPGLAVRACIPNGIDLSWYRPAPQPDGSYFLCLGRICHEKGFDRALRAARGAGVRLLLAGHTFDYAEHRRYFAEEIEPLLDGERRFVGAVRGEAKRALIANAAAVVVPSRVAETCSLVTLEALACGTPVIVPGVGAPASLIEPGVTGWVAHDEAGFVQAMLRAGELSRAACRAQAQRFDLAGMTRRYLGLYSELEAAATPGRGKPAACARAPRDAIELVTELERLRAIEPLLHELFERDPGATPFQSPDWLVPWVEQLGAPGALRWLVIHRGGRAVGSLPLMRIEDASGSALGWVGSGVTDRQDLLVDPAERDFVLDRARGALDELSREMDRVELDELPTPALSTLVPGSQVEPGCVCPVLELGRTPAELEAVMPRWLWRNIQQTERRLARLGSVEWRLASEGDAGELVDAFCSLHAARWQSRGEPGVLADPAVLAFHHAAAPRLIARGCLELEVGFLDGRPIAASHVLRRQHAHLYLFGFDPGWPKLSLGSLAIWRSIRRAANAGLARYDFLRGCEPYKYAFGAQNQQSFRCVAVRREAQPRA